MRYIGTSAIGIRTPIIRQGDDLVGMIITSLENAITHDNLKLYNKDIIGVTEAIVARAQGNYATTDQISSAVSEIFSDSAVGVVFPIMSRNRFATLLEGIAKNREKVYVQLSYPSDEVGNSILTPEQISAAGVNPFSDSFTEKTFRETFGFDTKHFFTGVDYIECYKSLSPNIEIIVSNDPKYIFNYTKNVIASDIHTRAHTKATLKNAGAEIVCGLDDILTKSVDGSGFNENYGLLGSNKSGETSVKLFPRECDKFVLELQSALKTKFDLDIEVMIYGDGAFKDPKAGIWELADPVVSPAYTSGLEGTPNELKLKYLADNEFSQLKDAELEEALKDSIRHKTLGDMGKVSLGTTPRQLPDILGSLCDLVSGSGDKGTPVILIQGYFDSFASSER